ncbi:MAG: hypothetical protein FWG05_00485 [Kiritimatiellaeota bacterium]|nr:hypothetical protein [Kiritimatiellota bacterium]
MRGFLCDYPELRHYKIAISKHIKFIVVSDLKNHVTYSPHTGVLIMPIRVGQTDSALFAMTFIVGLIESVKKSWFRVKCDDDAAVVAQKRFLATFPEWKDIYKWAFDEEPGDTVLPPLKQIKPRMISLIRISAVFGWFFSFVATIGLMEPLGKLIDVPLPVFLLIMWTPFILLTRRFVKIISRYD